MPAPEIQQLPSSTFHYGEATLQNLVDFRQHAEYSYSSFIQPAMPRQHRDFYDKLPYILFAHLDTDGRPWCSFLHGQPGFVTSPDARSLSATFTPTPGDEVARRLVDVTGGRARPEIAFLGLDMGERRRNRMNGAVVGVRSMRDGRVEVRTKVTQAFGNCPKYIQAWRVVGKRDSSKAVVEKWQKQSNGGLLQATRLLDGKVEAMVARADTMFIATRYLREGKDKAGNEPSQAYGLDVSHRGGEPGFIKVEDGGKVIYIPDYAGNNMFW
ncbi:hypothetical protein HK101_005905 [Irineochytrium annulatum]|nr:hypothetical protein HK101_005905 [Irineochytrium annulatum]